MAKSKGRSAGSMDAKSTDSNPASISSPSQTSAPKAKAPAAPRAKKAEGRLASEARPATAAAPKAIAKPAAKPRTNGKSAERPAVAITLTHDQIARRAYEIWIAKGRPMGQDDQNWNEAVADLQQINR